MMKHAPPNRVSTGLRVPNIIASRHLEMRYEYLND
jgi:hypothetical protein